MEQIPNFIYCSITGIRFAVRRDVMLDRIKQAGSLERLQKTYVSRDARRLLKEGKTIEQIRAELGYDQEHANNNLTFEVARSSSSMARVRIREGDHIDTFWRNDGFAVPDNWNRIPANIEECTANCCQNPPRWYDKDCKNCPFFSRCTFSYKEKYRK